MKREAALDAREQEQDEREKRLDLLEGLDAEVENGDIDPAGEKRLRDAQIIRDEVYREPILQVQYERVRQRQRCR